MFFNSFHFLYFFLIVYALYWFLSHRAQNLWLLGASFVFYGWWDWRFLSLLGFSIVADFYFAQAIEAAVTDKRRRFLLVVSVCLSLGILGFFKYFGFFSQELARALSGLNIGSQAITHLNVLDWVLPLGISFYTFQTISYVVDVYRKRIAATHDLMGFALYVAFFPHLIAGPIVRAESLLGQIQTPRYLTSQSLREAFWFLLYGYFLKTVVADNLAPLVRSLHSSPASLEAWQLLPAFYATSFMIYADFSGYSNIARGLGKLLGIELGANFRMPFFAKNPPDFWRRWHISLSNWFRDYVFTPLLSLHRRPSKYYMAACAFFTLLLCGLWHGAAWNFIAFGALHGALLVAYYALRSVKRRTKSNALRLTSSNHPWIRMASVLLSFHLLALAAVLFISRTPGDWWLFLKRLFTEGYRLQITTELWTLVIFGGMLCFFEFIQELVDRAGRDGLVWVPNLPLRLSWPIFTLLFALIVLCGATGTHAFVYFQF